MTIIDMLTRSLGEVPMHEAGDDDPRLVAAEVNGLVITIPVAMLRTSLRDEFFQRVTNGFPLPFIPAARTT